MYSFMTKFVMASMFLVVGGLISSLWSSIKMKFFMVIASALLAIALAAPAPEAEAEAEAEAKSVNVRPENGFQI